MSSESAFTPVPDLGRPLRVIVTGGGTGGHTYPAVSAVRALRARAAAAGAALDVLWVGAAGSLESRVAADEGIEFRAVATGKIRRASNPLKMITVSNIRDMARVPLGIVQARSVVAGFRPDVVLATGGYVCIPVGLAAFVCRRPLIVHEQTVRLGLANKVLARGAARMAVSSDSTLALLPAKARGRAVVTGNPVRPEVLAGTADKAVEALGLQGFDRSLPTIYVTGGAQGSAQINKLVDANLPWLLERANLVHQCGPANVGALRDHADALPPDLAARYLLAGYVGPELPDVLALADIVIGRSGAGTLAEVTALGKASVLVPLASAAGNEQHHNARLLHDDGAAVALLATVSPETLRQAVEPLLTDPAQRQATADRARAHGRPEAAELLADAVLSVVGR